jgi:predicted nucleic acid-binding protein
MSFLLDTNVISEPRKPQPDAKVMRFLHEADEDRLYLSVISLAELHRGVALMADGQRRRALAEWVESELPQRFSDRLLPFTRPAAALWGEMMARSRQLGLNIHIMDCLLAATAEAHDLTLATRNGKHFAGLDIRLLDPWAGR